LNEHSIIDPGTEVNVNRSPDLRARMETIIGGAAAGVAAAVVAVVISPVCRATAV
jgi:hypothetical protein